MIFDEAKDYTEGVWCDYDEKVSVKVRPMTRAKLRELKQQATQKKKGFRLPQFENELFERLSYDYLIEDWKGIVTPKGEPVPCTEKNKVAVCNVFIPFEAWLTATSAELAEQSEQEKGEEIKNSTTGQAGRPFAPEESEAAAPANTSGS